MNSIKLDNLRLKFPGEQSLLFKSLSLHIPPGQKVLLLGPSGSGKSTLLQVLSGIIPETVDMPMKADEIQLPRSWGFVFQDPETQFCMAYVDEELAFVLENLQIPRAEMETHMRNILADVGLHFDDLHTPIDTLSQGMKQRLALASVLLLEPNVLFLDEPTALLDPAGTEKIWENVKQISTDKTVIIVEHKIEHVADLVERVILMNHDGEIIADGQPSEIFAAYKVELIEYGIWYPEVWDDYIAGDSYERMMDARRDERSSLPVAQKPVITLEYFSGYRGEEEKVNVRQAEVHAGQWIAIVGPNGAGKSTLMLSLMQILRTSGTYVLDGQAVEPLKKRRGKYKLVPPDQLAFVFQNPELQFLTNHLFDEIAYDLRIAGLAEGEITVKVRDILAAFDLSMDEQRHPYQLSIGQKRRLSIASAIVNGKKVILLDEPTFGQDAKNTFAILEMLESLRREGATIIMVTHDLRIVEYFADESWHIEAGVLTAIEYVGDRDSSRGGSGRAQSGSEGSDSRSDHDSSGASSSPRGGGWR